MAKPALSQEVLSTAAAGEGCGSPAAVDDAVLRRISLSANAKAATPPTMARRRTPEGPSGDSAAAGESQVSKDVGHVATVNATEVAAETDAKGATVADAGLDDSLREGFSDLARAFTCMEVA